MLALGSSVSSLGSSGCGGSFGISETTLRPVHSAKRRDVYIPSPIPTRLITMEISSDTKARKLAVK